MFAIDRNELVMSQGAASGSAEPTPAILPLPSASERYGYQPDRKRFASALLVTALIHVAMLSAFLAWHVEVRVQPPAPPLTVTLLPLSPPARAEPEPVRRQKATPISREPPVVQPMRTPSLPSALPALVPAPPPLPAEASTTPTLPVPVMPVANSAPDVAPPSPPTQSAGKDSWEARVVACLESLKRFPPAARSRRDQGVATVRFRVNRHGTLLSLSLEASSGNRLLDQEALATVARAEPYPPIPAGRPDEIEVVVPIEFFLGSRRSH